MTTQPYTLLVSAAGQLLQQHAFDHLTDEKLARMQNCLRNLNGLPTKQQEQLIEKELLQLCEEVNLYVDTATPQSIQQWYTALSCFGLNMQTLIEAEE